MSFLSVSTPLLMTQDVPPGLDFVDMVESCVNAVCPLKLLLLLHAQPNR